MHPVVRGDPEEVQRVRGPGLRAQVELIIFHKVKESDCAAGQFAHLVHCPEHQFVQGVLRRVFHQLKDYLELAGYKVFTAQDGIDGIVQARHVKPDLILMDVQMPHMDGFETTRKLRSDPNFRYTPIIALTALAMPHDRERCLEAGMDEYMSKPVNLKALVRIIQSCLFEQESSK